MYKNLNTEEQILLLFNCFTTPVIIVMFSEIVISIAQSNTEVMITFKECCHVCHIKDTVKQRTEMKTCALVQPRMHTSFPGSSKNRAR